MSFSSSSNSSKEALLAVGNGGDGGGGCNSNNNNNNEDEESLHVIMKGKRTKRPRLNQAAQPVAMTASSTTTSAGSYASTTEEEEDMANCLILLAQGPKLESKLMEGKGFAGGSNQKVMISRRFVDVAATTAIDNKAAGFYMYQCKTCSKRFPSFQALGGHRTSHKKPKMAASVNGQQLMEGKKPPFVEDYNLQISIASFPRTVTMANNCNASSKTRVHECSICGSEFSSGQALGGHMRRHRPVPIPTVGSSQEPKKEKSLLSLDLNLPAPSDDERGSSASTFTFGTGEQTHVFSALVDCHY